MWLKDARCEEIVKEAWEEGELVGSEWPISKCLERCKVELMRWNKEEFGNVGMKVAELQARLAFLETQPTTSNQIHELRKTRIELNRWLDKEAEMWRQRARKNWFQCGDRNTKFFHAKALDRQSKNHIDGIFYGNGVWHEDEVEIAGIFVDYYTCLFSSSSPMDFEETLHAIEPKVSREMNADLSREFHEGEVRKALKQMYPLKAPGPDGMPPLFYQHFWSTCSRVLCNTVLAFLNNGISPPNFNQTHVVLIPKVKEPKHVTDFRPISSCNVIYKIASKTIANRFKRILQSIISDSQSAFVHGRLITDMCW